MPTRPFGRRPGERGATLIHMAIAMVALMAFSALVIDYGIFWVARRQAQNSADAGALAGAIAYAFDNSTDLSDTGPAKMNAVAAAQRNLVWGLQPSVVPATDVTIAQGLPGCEPLEYCIKVDVYRTVARSNALPTFFARLVGVNTQDVQATATARVVTGNATNCMRPWGILDKWDEYDITATPGEPEYLNAGGDPDWNLSSTFDKYPQGGNSPPYEPDLYVAPPSCTPGTSCGIGTGFRLFDTDGVTPVDYGKEIKLHTGSQDQTSSGWFLPVRLQPSDSGAQDYCDNIKQCSGVTNIIGQTILTEQGNMVGPTKQCTFTDGDSLYNQDPSAHWDPNGLGPGIGAIVSDDYGPNQSPRIVPLPVISPEELFASDPNGLTQVTVRNILGFFVERQEDQGGHTLTVGRLINVPGVNAGGNTVDPSQSFIKQIVLVR